jgi:hypothetical protein
VSNEGRQLHNHRGSDKKYLVEKPKGKRPFTRCRHRWKDNIKMDLKETGKAGVD